MNNVIYRDLNTKDYEKIKELIKDAFQFENFIKEPKLLEMSLDMYLQETLATTSFYKVAEKDGNVIGFIFGYANKDENNMGTFEYKPNLDEKEITSLMQIDENKSALEDFEKISIAYKNLIKGCEENFQGGINLFVVSPESRGLGVGKTLINSLYSYMKDQAVNSMYLFTDTRCNYGFYDSQNFKRIKESPVSFNSLDTNLTAFLYEYKF